MRGTDPRICTLRIGFPSLEQVQQEGGVEEPELGVMPPGATPQHRSATPPAPRPGRGPDRLFLKACRRDHTAGTLLSNKREMVEKQHMKERNERRMLMEGVN